MANAMESLFSGMYHPVKVTAITYLSDSLKKVRFEGDFSALKKDFIPGNVIEFRVSDTEFRHYTPSHFDKEAGVCEVAFYLHGKGPGSRWAAKLANGDSLKLIGPGGKIGYDKDADLHILYGDETSLGLFRCMSRKTMSQKKSFYGIAELEEDHSHWPGLLDIQAETIAPHPSIKAHGAQVKLKARLHSYTGDKNKLAFYLTGNAKAVQAFRDDLLKLGFQRSQIQADPYWAEGKRGL